MYPDRKYMDKPANDDLEFEPFTGEYDSPFAANMVPFSESQSAFSHNMVPFSENPIPFSENISSYAGNLQPFENNTLNKFDNRGLFGENFNKIKVSSAYWLNSLFHNSTDVGTGYIPIPTELFNDIDNEFDNSLSNTKVNEILSTIENQNDSILKTLETYKIPYPVSKLIIKKIIALSLNYSSNK